MQRLLQAHDEFDLISFFKLPRALLMDILINWITIDTLCTFDTAVCAKDSRMYLLHDIFVDEVFVVESNKFVNLKEESLHSRQQAVLLANYLHIRQLVIKNLDFSQWQISYFEIRQFLQYLWQYDVENRRYRQLRALSLPRSAINFDSANVIGSKLKYVCFLSLRGCGGNVGDSEFQNLIFTCTHLTTLDISYCCNMSGKSRK